MLPRTPSYSPPANLLRMLVSNILLILMSAEGNSSEIKSSTSSNVPPTLVSSNGPLPNNDPSSSVLVTPLNALSPSVLPGGLKKRSILAAAPLGDPCIELAILSTRVPVVCVTVSARNLFLNCLTSGTSSEDTSLLYFSIFCNLLISAGDPGSPRGVLTGSSISLIFFNHFPRSFDFVLESACVSTAVSYIPPFIFPLLISLVRS